MVPKTARSPDPTLPVPSDAECGEAMRLLTPSQRAFVVALVESGAENHTACAMRAGYSGNNEARTSDLLAHDAEPEDHRRDP
jgi:hypothetical protein